MTDEGRTAARVVLMTAPDPETAKSLVRTLVEEKVVACGTIVPAVLSIYRWAGKMEEATESLIIFKTTESGAERLMVRAPELHPYDVPELLVLPVEAGHPPYLDWVVKNVDMET